jgi:hypothetical protein
MKRGGISLRIAIPRRDTLRIEPYSMPLPVVAAKK